MWLEAQKNGRVLPGPAGPGGVLWLVTWQGGGGVGGEWQRKRVLRAGKRMARCRENAGGGAGRDALQARLERDEKQASVHPPGWLSVEGMNTEGRRIGATRRQRGGQVWCRLGTAGGLN